MDYNRTNDIKKVEHSRQLDKSFIVLTLNLIKKINLIQTRPQRMHAAVKAKGGPLKNCDECVTFLRWRHIFFGQAVHIITSLDIIQLILYGDIRPASLAENDNVISQNMILHIVHVA